MKSVSFSPLIEHCEIGTEIDNLLTLPHPLIAPLADSGFSVESSAMWEFKRVRLHAAAGSLADILSNRPAWWTPTAKAKAVAGIALALRFARGIGLVHGALKARNVLVDADRRIHFAAFSAIRRESGDVEPFSGEEWTPVADVSAFAFFLVGIAITASGESRVSAVVPEFVSG
jgi:hypothetical protein